jgi:glycosyltransferase involved in cell wall biosynthesis
MTQTEIPSPNTDAAVEWRGEILSAFGPAIKARMILKMLLEAGLPLKIIPNDNHIPQHLKIVDTYWARKIAESAIMTEANVRINYCPPPEAEYKDGALNILCCTWETTRFPIAWAQKMNQADFIIVESQDLVIAATAAGVNKPIVALPTPVDTDMFSLETPRMSIEGVGDEDFVFMINCSWIPRKNFGDLLIAYVSAFAGTSNTVLVIKTWGEETVQFKATVHQNVRDRIGAIDIGPKPRIIVFPDRLPDLQYAKFLSRADVYVSFSHGEGYDLPMMQAMSMGKLCIGQPFLGRSEFMRENNSYPVRYTLAPVVDAKVPLYTGDQLWSRPDLQHAVHQMQRAYKASNYYPHMNKHGKLAIAEKARQTIVDNFSVSKCTNAWGQILQNLINQAAKQPEPEVQHA